MHLLDPIISFFVENTPPVKAWMLGGPPALAWAYACLSFAGWCKCRRGCRTGYTRKIFHFLIFFSVAIVQVVWGTPGVCLFGSVTTLVIAYALWRGDGHPMYEAMAREKDAPRRTYFIIAPYFATLLGGMASNILFGELAIIGYLVTGLGDAIAEPVGTRWGRHAYRVPSLRGVASHRTIEGSFSVFVACVVSLVLTGFLLPHVTFGLTSLLLIAFACSVIEAFSPHGWDNFTMQLLPAWLASLIF